MKRVLTISVAVALVIACLAGCGETFHNATVSSRDTSGAKVLNEPLDIGNVAVKCDGTNMVYASKTGVAVVSNDPRCGK